MIRNGKQDVWIYDQSDLDYLLELIHGSEPFANQFKFPEREFFFSLLDSLEINHKKFEQNNFYFDATRRLHISESQSNYVWISTFGLIAKNKITTNKAVNACINQCIVISLLLKEAIRASEGETVYDVDSYEFEYLSELSPALFHNLLFYIEVFCKAYLSLNDIAPLRTHKVSALYQKMMETMYANKHNDSNFHIRILNPLYRFVDHVNSLPVDFKEHFVKYDDNSMDDTVIVFQSEFFNDLLTTVDLSNDFILDYFHMGEATFYLKSGVYQRLLNKAKTEEEKKKVRDLYGYLVRDN